MRQLEYQLQKAVVEWLGYSYSDKLFCASAGGMRTNMTTAKKMKATGYKKGFPDLFIYERNKKFNGLAIELKVLKGVNIGILQALFLKFTIIVKGVNFIMIL